MGIHINTVHCNTVVPYNLPKMGDEFKWLLKEGDGCIFESCAHLTVSLALFVCACSDSAMPLLSCA